MKISFKKKYLYLLSAFVLFTSTLYSYDGNSDDDDMMNGGELDDVYCYPDDDSDWDYWYDDLWYDNLLNWFDDNYGNDYEEDYDYYEENYDNPTDNNPIVDPDPDENDEADFYKNLLIAIENLSPDDFNNNTFKFVDLDGNGVIDGYFYKDSKGVIHFRTIGAEDVIIEGNGIRKNPNPLPTEDLDIPKLPETISNTSAEVAKPVSPNNNNCNSAAQEAVKNLMNGLDTVKRIDEALDLLRKYIQTNSKDETTIIINKDGTIRYLPSTGNVGTDIPPNTDSYLKVHVHPYYTFSSPSTSDVYLFIIQARSYANFQGSMIIAADGSEYLLYADNREQVKKIVLNNWTPTQYGEFSDPDMFKKEERYMELLEEQGYSHYQAYEYTMAMLISEYAPGLKLYKRSNKNEDFKQMNPAKINNVITPQTCN